jgi:monoamine oxidase
MYSTLIIGSGLSGLYCAYELQDKNAMVLEKECRIGGRIHTVCTQGMCMEAGAGRFNAHHKKLRELIRKLDLEKHVVPLDGKLVFSPSGKYEEKYVGQNPFDVLDPVLARGQRASIKTLQSKTFIEYAKTILSSSDLKFVVDSFGYYEQLVHMNAYDAIKLFEKGMHSKNEFYGMRGGLSQIIQALCRKVVCPIRTNQEVTHIEYHSPGGAEGAPYFTVHVKGRSLPYTARKCICALPKLALQKIPLFASCKKQMKCVGVKSLCRMYAKFSAHDTWVRHIPKTTTNNDNRYIIPIDREKGLVMIAYTDSVFAKRWVAKPQSQVIPAIRENIYQTFGFRISEPTFFRAFYWETGTAFWKPKCDSRIVAEKMIEPFGNGLFVCGENFSQTQGWMEGALETSIAVLQRIGQRGGAFDMPLPVTPEKKGQNNNNMPPPPITPVKKNIEDDNSREIFIYKAKLVNANSANGNVIIIKGENIAQHEYEHGLKQNNNMFTKKQYYVLKMSQNNSDNITYEFCVGAFLNNQSLNLFVTTYYLFKIKEYNIQTGEISLEDKLEDIIWNNYSNEGGLTCTELDKYCLIQEYFDGVSLKSKFSITDEVDENGNKKIVSSIEYKDILAILKQIYFPLHFLEDVFMHNDLHWGNVLVKEHDDEEQEIKMLKEGAVFPKYFYNDNPENSKIRSKYEVKLIDYGRSFYEGDNGNSTQRMFRELKYKARIKNEGYNKYIKNCGLTYVPYKLEDYKDIRLFGFIVSDNVYPELTNNLRAFLKFNTDEELINYLAYKCTYQEVLEFIDEELIKINPLQNNHVNTRKRPRENQNPNQK